MDVGALRAHARREVDELGPPPGDREARARWMEERRGAVVLCAALADFDPVLLRRAALHAVDEAVNPAARDLLLDAARVRK